MGIIGYNLNVKILKLDKMAINEAAKTIKAGGMVIYPSDTVYILAVDPKNQKAVDKLLSFKNRWTGKAISVAVEDMEMAMEYVELTENEKNLYKNILPGPFTVVSRARGKMAKGIEAEDMSLGIRIPDNNNIKRLVAKVGGPVTATSANLSGRKANYSIESFLRPLSEKKKELIDLIVDAGKLPRNKPSTVIDSREAEIKVLRRGDLVTGKEKSFVSKSEEKTAKIARFLFKKLMKRKRRGAMVLALTGELGCGKTVFSREIGRCLGVKEKITSPSFFIYNEYKTESEYKKFIHMDLYKIEKEFELKEIEFWELFEERNFFCIEWPEKMGEENYKKLSEKVEYIGIEFKYVSENEREISFLSE